MTTQLRILHPSAKRLPQLSDLAFPSSQWSGTVRRLVYLVFAVSLMFGQIVAASPREDAEYIFERITSDNGGRASLLHKIASRHVFFFKRELAEHSVTVVDSARFAENFPVDVTEPWLVRWQEIYVNSVLELLTPAQLDRVANSLRAEMEKTGTSQTFDREDNRLSMAVAINLMGSHLKVNDEIKQSMPQLNEAPYLADILETDGIFSFPNRIWRKDFVAKIRSGDENM